MRRQVQFTPEQLRALERAAGERGVSVAALVREAVDRALRAAPRMPEEERRRRALAVAGRFRSGCRDLSAEHDRYLGDAFGHGG